MLSLHDRHFPAPLPADETRRQAAVERSGIFTRPADPGLQAIVAQAAFAYRTAFAVISIIDRDRQWIAARAGIDVVETPRSQAFCAHAILRPGEPLVVGNAALDPRFSNYPAVRFTPHVRFYAGMPLVDRGGYPLGALCVFDYTARDPAIDISELMLLALRAERIVAP